MDPGNVTHPKALSNCDDGESTPLSQAMDRCRTLELELRRANKEIEILRKALSMEYQAQYPKDVAYEYQWKLDQEIIAAREKVT